MSDQTAIYKAIGMNVNKFMPLFSFAAGWICLAAMPPWSIWPAIFVGLSLYYVILQTAGTVRQGFVLGFLFAMGYFLPGLSWIANALLVEGNDFKWAWPLAILGLPILLSLFYGYSAALFVLLKQKTDNWLLFVFLLTITEWIRGYIFTGFPWNLFGYSWDAVPQIMQVSAIGGIYLLSLLTIVWGTAIGATLDKYTGKHRKYGVVATAILTFAFCFSYGYFRLEQNPTMYRDDVSVQLVQPDIKQKDKWNREKTAENLNTLLRLSEKDNTINTQNRTVIIWPETAISYSVFSQPSVKAAITGIMQQHPADSVLLTGMLRSIKDGNDTKHYNSMSIIDRNGNILKNYNKTHLVPFGEYIPFKDLVPFKPFAFYSGFSAGKGSYPTDIGSGLFINPLICYEIVFPGKAKTEFGNNMSSALINITNDAWYGNSSGPRQHFAMAKYRAIETGIPVIRVANTGISGIIDPLGRTLYKIDINTEKKVVLGLPQTFIEKSLYSKYKGLPYYLLVFGIIITLFIVRKDVPSHRDT